MILQKSLPYEALTEKRLPGISPMDPATWLVVDDAYAAQMRERERLIATLPRDVLYLDEAARPAANELLDTVLDALPDMFRRDSDHILRPDGEHITLDRGDPLRSLGLLVQEDFVLMIRDPDESEHRLRGAVLCFPSRWRLREKAGKPLVAIHRPVPSYDSNIAKRVQRLFNGVQVGRPLWRFNTMWHDDPVLYQPRSELAPKEADHDPDSAPYFRTEKQGVLRLPETNAVVFSIHTFVVARSTLDASHATLVTNE